MTLFLSIAGVVAFLLAVIVMQWSYQRSMRNTIITLHKRASSAEMSLASMQRTHGNLLELEKVQHAQNLQASMPEHLSRRADFESDWLPTGRDHLPANAQNTGTDAADFTESNSG